MWANITKGPDVIFHDNDFEVFVDPAGSNHHYKEFEINANCAKWARESHSHFHLTSSIMWRSMPSVRSLTSRAQSETWNIDSLLTQFA